MSYKFHVEMYDVPEWLFKFLKFLRIGKIYALPEQEEDELSNMIEKKQYAGAKNYLKYLERKYGVSTLTVRYSARIDRMEILGK